MEFFIVQSISLLIRMPTPMPTILPELRSRPNLTGTRVGSVTSDFRNRSRQKSGGNIYTVQDHFSSNLEDTKTFRFIGNSRFRRKNYTVQRMKKIGSVVRQQNQSAVLNNTEPEALYTSMYCTVLLQ